MTTVKGTMRNLIHMEASSGAAADRGAKESQQRHINAAHDKQLADIRKEMANRHDSRGMRSRNKDA